MTPETFDVMETARKLGISPNLLDACFDRMKKNAAAKMQDLMQLAALGIPVFDLLAKATHVDALAVRERVEQGNLSTSFALDEIEKWMSEFARMD